MTSRWPRSSAKTPLKEKNYADAVKYLGIALPSKANNLEFLFTYGSASTTTRFHSQKL